MPPLSFTLRHNAATFDWELAVAGDSAASHHATHSSAFDMLATHPQLFARGATVRVFGADGGYECERTYAAAGSVSDTDAAVSTVAL
ncbi:hypothetical protein [Luteimonas sp. 3794]|uniref:hypothetical protein n=1 Tax=Luteimonas sp. 3794 TaxID=2817730 RepID=UPI002859E78E|nr:hypothetical protein [Luteimonas sp. 3794]MDR6992944.1 hypothetical protein [Luteimonas sp. 3794]